MEIAITSQSLSNQGNAQTVLQPVMGLLICLNPFQIRAMRKHQKNRTYQRSGRLNPFQIRAMRKRRDRKENHLPSPSQSLSNQGNAQTKDSAKTSDTSVSIPFKSGQCANLTAAWKLRDCRLNPFQIRAMRKRFNRKAMVPEYRVSIPFKSGQCANSTTKIALCNQ